jgi:tetratricopeptide (TPR) repeat protein
MAKQSRPAPNKVARSSSKTAGTREARTAGAPRAATQTSAGPPLPNPPHRSTYVEAVALYEQAIERLHHKQYAEAVEQFHRVLAYPDEKELAERARLYLAFCERHLSVVDAEPQSAPERLYAATLALNAGQFDRAIRYLGQVVEHEPGNDRALYLLAAAHAERGQLGLAIPYLQRAIEANPENRARARTDPDLEVLRREAAVAALLEPPAPQGSDGRRISIRARGPR